MIIRIMYQGNYWLVIINENCWTASNQNLVTTTLYYLLNKL